MFKQLFDFLSNLSIFYNHVFIWCFLQEIVIKRISNKIGEDLSKWGKCFHKRHLTIFRNVALLKMICCLFRYDYSAFLPAAQYIFCVCFFSAANVSQEGDMSFHFDIRLYVLECSICFFWLWGEAQVVRGSTTKTLQNRQCSKVPWGCKH